MSCVSCYRAAWARRTRRAGGWRKNKYVCLKKLNCLTIVPEISDDIVIDNDQRKISKRTSHMSKFQCPQCDKTYSDHSGLRYHNKSVHEGVKYACNQCDYQATTQSHLTVHIQSKHEGVKYSCNQCDYQVKTQVGLTYHIQSKHEGLKYACN